MSSSGKIAIIQALAAIPANERDLATSLALKLITKSTTDPSRKNIIAAVGAIPIHERNDVIQHALKLMNPGMFSARRIQIVQNVAAVPANERANFVRVAGVPGNGRLFFARGQGRGARPAAAPQSMNIHNGDRSKRTKAAIELLRKHQGSITHALIDQANKEFVHYLDASPIKQEDKTLAKNALLKPKGPKECYGPLLDNEPIRINF